MSPDLTVTQIATLVRQVAANAAETCIELGHPERIREMIMAGADTDDVRKALSNMPKPSAATKSDDALAQLGAERFAQRRQRNV